MAEVMGKLRGSRSKERKRLPSELTWHLDFAIRISEFPLGDLPAPVSTGEIDKKWIKQKFSGKVTWALRGSVGRWWGYSEYKTPPGQSIPREIVSYIQEKYTQELKKREYLFEVPIQDTIEVTYGKSSFSYVLPSGCREFLLNIMEVAKHHGGLNPPARSLARDLDVMIRTITKEERNRES